MKSGLGKWLESMGDGLVQTKSLAMGHGEQARQGYDINSDSSWSRGPQSWVTQVRQLRTAFGTTDQVREWNVMRSWRQQ